MSDEQERILPRICPFCEATCGLDVTLEGARVVGVRGRPSDVFSRGYLCPKAFALKDLHDDPDRLKTPLIRRGGRFVEASFDDAFAEIAGRFGRLIEAHGRDSVAVYLGNPNVHKLGLVLYGRHFLKALGTRNIMSASTLDQMPKHVSSGLLYGGWLSIPVPDIERTDYLLMLGANPVVSNGSLWTVPDVKARLEALRRRGGRLVVVDPRRSETAALADRHVALQPGGDVFFLLGLAHVIVSEQRVRLGPLAEHVVGMDELGRQLEPFSPAEVAARAGCEPSVIVELARELAAAERAAVYGRIGTTTQPYGTTASWLIDVLNILTGNLDRPGGALFPKAPAFATNTLGMPGRGRGVSTGRRRSRVSGLPEVMGELPAACLAEEIETPGPGQVRALFTIAGNPVLSAPEGERLRRAFSQLELMVSLDIYLNETTRHADVVLPALSPLEESHYDVAFTQFSYRNVGRYSPALLPKPAGQWAEWEVLLALTQIARGEALPIDVARLDDALLEEEVRRLVRDQAPLVLAALGAQRGPERWLDLGLRGGPYGDYFGLKPGGLSLAALQAAPDGIDLGPLEPRLPEVLRTPSGKIELVPPALAADLQRVKADLGRTPPELVLIGRRHLRSNNSWMHNLPSLAKGPYRCTVLVHPRDAARAGVQSGQMARLSAGAASVEALVEVSEEMKPGVVSLPHGWGHDDEATRQRVALVRPGVNVNLLADTRTLDPLSGTATLSGIAVTLEALGAGSAVV